MTEDALLRRSELDPEVVHMLDSLGLASGQGDARGVVLMALASLEEGVRRPGSTERLWLRHVFGTAWQAALEVDPDASWRERFPVRCVDCENALDALDRQNPRQRCHECAAFIAADESARRRAGRLLPLHDPRLAAVRASPSGQQALERDAQQAAAEFNIPRELHDHLVALVEWRAGSVATERHRPREDAGDCLDPRRCPATQEFLCAACCHWKCDCRGGPEEPTRVRSFCDTCAAVYRAAWAPWASCFLRLLEARVASVCAGTFVADRLPDALRRLIGQRGRPEARVRRLVGLALRGLRSASSLERLAVVLAGWPGLRADVLARYRWREKYIEHLLIAATLRTADGVAFQLRQWRREFRRVFTDPAIVALIEREPTLAWLSGTPAGSGRMLSLLVGLFTQPMAVEDAQRLEPGGELGCCAVASPPEGP